MGYIYKISNLKNNKIYIGKTTGTIQKRFKQHIRNAQQHINRYLYDAMNCYGYDNFKIEQIEQVNNDQLDEREIFWIAFLNSQNPQIGYNMTSGGQGGDTWTNNPHKQETIKKIKEKNTGKKRTSEQIERLKEAQQRKAEEITYTMTEAQQQEFKQDIINGMSATEIKQKYGFGEWAFVNHCKHYFNMTPRELRGGNRPLIKQYQMSEQALNERIERNKKMFSGAGNVNYKEVDKDKLLELLLANKTNAEIAEYFNISKPTVINKCKQYFNGLTPKEVKKQYAQSKN